MTAIEQEHNNDKWWIAAIIALLFICLLNATRVRAEEKRDTIPIDYASVERVITQQGTSPRSTKYYIVYRANGFRDIVSTTKTTVKYIQLCKENKIEPNLGVVIKGNRIISIVKINRKYDAVQ